MSSVHFNLLTSRANYTAGPLANVLHHREHILAPQPKVTPLACHSDPEQSRRRRTPASRLLQSFPHGSLTRLILLNQEKVAEARPFEAGLPHLNPDRSTDLGLLL